MYIILSKLNLVRNKCKQIIANFFLTPADSFNSEGIVKLPLNKEKQMCGNRNYYCNGGVFTRRQFAEHRY